MSKNYQKEPKHFVKKLKFFSGYKKRTKKFHQKNGKSPQKLQNITQILLKYQQKLQEKLKIPTKKQKFTKKSKILSKKP